MTRRNARTGHVLAVGLFMVALVASPAFAQGPTELGKPPAEQSVGELLFQIRHYILISDFQLATKYIDVLMARKPAGPEVLKAIADDAVLNNNDNGLAVVLDKGVLSTDPKLRKAAAELKEFIKQATIKSIRDPAVINAEIQRLSNPNLRVIEDAIRNLRDMAPWSVPLLIDVLIKDDKSEIRPNVILTLPKMGRGAVEVLCEALDIPNAVPVKMNLVGALMEIGYPQAIPYIQRVMEQADSDQLRQACKVAIDALKHSPRAMFAGSAGHMFVQLGDDYYKDQPSLRSPVEGGLVPVWSWDAKVQGVKSVEVPKEIYVDVLAMRSYVRGLKLDSNQPEAVSMWIASNIRKEAHLPAGAKDPTRAPEQPDAHYYAVAAGPTYLLRALARSVQDSDAPVALGLVRALNDVGFATSAGPDAGALAMALQFPDRRVRYEAALALATAHFKSQLPGAEYVVPTLSDALVQTGERYALALLAAGPEQEKLLASVRDAGYRVETATTQKAIFLAARAADVPHVDLLLVGYEMPEGGLNGLSELRKDYRFRHTPTLLVATAPEKAEGDIRDLTGIGVIQVSAPKDEISEKVAKLMSKTGESSMSADEAKGYALRAAAALREVAISSPPGMNYALAIPALIRALADPRAELAVAAGDTLSYADDATGQRALAQAGLDAKAEAPRRASQFKALAGSVKRFGNKLTDDQVTVIIKSAMEEAQMDVRTAAAQAVGALNLPSMKIDTLIVKSDPTL